MKPSGLLVTGLLVVLAGCAAKPSTESPPVAAMTEPERQYMCVSKIYLSDVSRAHTLSGRIDGDDFVVPIGEHLARQIAARFWVDSTRQASGRPQPTVTTGFAPGTGVRPAKRGGAADVQVVLQFQLLKPTGQSYYDMVGGKAVAATADVAANQALEQALQRLESVLTTAGICRSMQ